MPVRAGLAALVVGVFAGWADGGQRLTGSVSGLVVDARTGQPLQHARVMLDGQPGRVVTGPEGRFLLADLPAGAGVLQVSLVGYGLARRHVDVPARGSLDLTIPLAEGTSTYEEDVKVQGDLFPREAPGVASQISIGSAELQNLRGLLADDPMRAVQTLPGVAGSDDLRSDFSIRASDFRHIGVTLDGIPSSLLVHTVRNVDDGGSLAMVNSDVLDGVSLVAGSYPQRYGDRTGAHVDFRTREGSRDRTQTRLSVSAINASLVAEGPLGRERRASWLLTIRKSYLDWLIRRIDPEVTGTFGFVDGQGKVVVDLSPRHAFTVSFVAGRSRYDERQEDPEVNSLEVGRHRSVLASAALRSTFGSSMVLTQRVYGVDNRFSNENAATTPLETGTERDASYRADMSLRTRWDTPARGRCAPAVAARGRRRVVLRAGRRSAGAAAFPLQPHPSGRLPAGTGAPPRGAARRARHPGRSMDEHGRDESLALGPDRAAAAGRRARRRRLRRPPAITGRVGTGRPARSAAPQRAGPARGPGNRPADRIVALARHGLQS